MRPEIKLWEFFLLNLSSYARRAARCLAFMLAYLLLCALLLAALLLAVYATKHDADLARAAQELLASLTGVAHPVWIDEEGLQSTLLLADSDLDAFVFGLCVFVVAVTGVLGLVFSGAFTAAFLSPIDPIKFAPFVVVDPRRACLSVRFWICYRAGTYLQDVRIVVREYGPAAYDSSTIRVDPDGGVPMGGQLEARAVALRGVWEIEIPFSPRDGAPEPASSGDPRRADGDASDVCGVIKRKLERSEKGADCRTGIQVIVQGRTESGEMITRVRRYGAESIVGSGYQFALYHCLNEYQTGATGREKCKLERPSYLNFMKLVDTSEAQRVANANEEPVLNALVDCEVDPSVAKECETWNSLLSGYRTRLYKKKAEKALLSDEPAPMTPSALTSRHVIAPSTDWRPGLSPKAVWEINGLP